MTATKFISIFRVHSLTVCECVCVSLEMFVRAIASISKALYGVLSNKTCICSTLKHLCRYTYTHFFNAFRRNWNLKSRFPHIIMLENGNYGVFGCTFRTLKSSQSSTKRIQLATKYRIIFASLCLSFLLSPPKLSTSLHPPYFVLFVLVSHATLNSKENE